MWNIGHVQLRSRLMLGSALYPSPRELKESIRASGTEIVTVSLRRQSPETNGGGAFWRLIKNQGVHVLPNTAGCRTADEAVTIALMSRELFGVDWIKLEVTADDYTLEPDPEQTVIAAKRLVAEGFQVLPYSTDSLVLCDRLFQAGCVAVMPWAAPIGSGRGPRDLVALETLRSRFPSQTLIIDAGIGKPSHAAIVMEMGFDAVLLNSAVALSHECATMAGAFKLAIEAGRAAHEAGMMQERNLAKATTPIPGTPFQTAPIPGTPFQTASSAGSSIQAASSPGPSIQAASSGSSFESVPVRGGML